MQSLSTSEDLDFIAKAVNAVCAARGLPFHHIGRLTIATKLVGAYASGDRDTFLAAVQALKTER